MMHCSMKILWFDEYGVVYVGVHVGSVIYWYCPDFDFWMIDGGGEIIQTTFMPAEVPALFLELYGNN